MKRLTTDDPKDNTQTALNLFYIRGGEAWVRGYGDARGDTDISLRTLMSKLILNFGDEDDAEIAKYSDEELDEALTDALEEGADSRLGVLALLYTAGWAFAELRERLKEREDAEEHEKEAVQKIWEEQLYGIPFHELKARATRGRKPCPCCKHRQKCPRIHHGEVCELYETWLHAITGEEYIGAFDRRLLRDLRRGDDKAMEKALEIYEKLVGKRIETPLGVVWEYKSLLDIWLGKRPDTLFNACGVELPESEDRLLADMLPWYKPEERMPELHERVSEELLLYAEWTSQTDGKTVLRRRIHGVCVGDFFMTREGGPWIFRTLAWTLLPKVPMRLREEFEATQPPVQHAGEADVKEAHDE